MIHTIPVLENKFYIVIFYSCWHTPFWYIFCKVMTDYVSSDEWRRVLTVGLVLVSVIAGVFYVRVISIIYEKEI